jgi:ketosteroid isomerase-like protein
MSDAARRSGEVTVATLEELLDAFNRHDLDRIMEFFSEDATFDMPRGTDPWGTRYVGKAEVLKGLASRFSGIPDVHYGEDRHWVSGDRAVSEWLLTGTSTSGEKIRVRGCDLFEIRDGKIIRKDSYWKIVG